MTPTYEQHQVQPPKGYHCLPTSNRDIHVEAGDLIGRESDTSIQWLEASSADIGESVIGLELVARKSLNGQ
jgi:hypothetical protein